MPANNFFYDHTAPVTGFRPVTPSDTVGLGAQARGIIASGAGNAVLVDAQGATITVALAAGVPLLGIGFVRVNATGTTSTGNVALL